MDNISRIAIIGTGCIGGSLGLAFKRARPGCTIVGLDAPSVLDEAAARGAVDERAARLGAAVPEADLVVLATPLPVTIRLLGELPPHLTDGALVTDTATVKRPVMAEAEEAGLPSFIGGRPVVRPEGHGIGAADAALLDGQPYVLCGSEGESETTLREAYPDFLNLIGATGAVPRVTHAAEHDRALANTDQLLRFVVAALRRVTTDESSADGEAPATPLLRALRAGMPASPEAWRAEAVGNQGPLLDALGRFASAFQSLRNRLIEEDAEALEQMVER